MTIHPQQKVKCILFMKKWPGKLRKRNRMLSLFHLNAHKVTDILNIKLCIPSKQRNFNTFAILMKRATTKRGRIGSCFVLLTAQNISQWEIGEDSDFSDFIQFIQLERNNF